MKRNLLLSVLLVGLVGGMGVLLIANGLTAGSKAPDVIKMENKAYDKHKENIIVFSHAKHAADYAKNHPEFFKEGCGECHHDENNKPLSGLKDGDPVKGCIECHKTPGEMPLKIKKEMRKEKLSKEEKQKRELEYHAEALHENCKGCHRNYNKKNKLKSKDEGYAPTTCKKCHG